MQQSLGQRQKHFISLVVFNVLMTVQYSIAAYKKSQLLKLTLPHVTFFGPLPTPQYLSSQAATICDNIIHIFGGYKAHASTITTKRDLNSTMFYCF